RFSVTTKQGSCSECIRSSEDVRRFARGMIETRSRKTQERALLIGLEKQGVSKWDLRDSLDELRELANSAGAEVVDTVTQKLQKPTAPYYIGRGKAESIKDSCQEQQVTSVIFNDELSPAQGRNL